LMVVLFHAGHGLGTWSPRFGYLAVDLFFLLSGFVLALSYEPRFRRGMGTAEFLIARIVRLYPLYFLGLVLGVATALLNMDFPGLTFRGVLVSFFFGLFGLPSDVVPQHQALFAVNGPCWSLFFEFWVANVVFVLFRKRLGWKALLTLILVCGIGLVATEKVYYTVSVGWGWDNFAPGFVRVGFSFFAGVALARIHAVRPAKLKLPSWLFILTLPLLLSLPLGGELSHRYELICVFVLFPALIYWGAAAFERRPWFGAALGDASYAMYVIHDPLWALCAWLVYKMAIQQGLVLQLAFVFGIVGLAWGLNIADTRARGILMSRIRAWRLSPSRAGLYLPVERRVAGEGRRAEPVMGRLMGQGQSPDHLADD